MGTDIILSSIYNPAIATGIAFVALIISLYVLYKQNTIGAKKTVRRKTARTKKSVKKFALPIQLLQAVQKEILILALVLCAGAGFFFLEARAAELKLGEHIKLGFQYIQQSDFFDQRKEVAVVAEAVLPLIDTAELETEDEIGEDDEAANEIEVAEKEELVAKAEVKPIAPKIQTPVFVLPPPPVFADPVPQDPPKLGNPEADGPAPDATVSTFSHYGSALVKGGLLSFSVIVSNKGEADMEDSFNTQLFIDEGNDGTRDLSFSQIKTRALKIGEQETKIWRSAWSAKVGTHRVEVCTDTENTLLEMNEKNNCAELVLTIEGNKVSGDLTVINLTMSPVTPTVGDTIYFSAKVKNIAGTKAGFSHTYLTINDKLLGKIRHSSISPGNSEDVSTAWKAVVGDHLYKVCADGSNEVFETNEDNNCAVGTFSVRGIEE